MVAPHIWFPTPFVWHHCLLVTSLGRSSCFGHVWRIMIIVHRRTIARIHSSFCCWPRTKFEHILLGSCTDLSTNQRHEWLLNLRGRQAGVDQSCQSVLSPNHLLIQNGKALQVEVRDDGPRKFGWWPRSTSSPQRAPPVAALASHTKLLVGMELL